MCIFAEMFLPVMQLCHLSHYLVYSLSVSLSSTCNRGAWSMWACSHFLSLFCVLDIFVGKNIKIHTGKIKLHSKYIYVNEYLFCCLVFFTFLLIDGPAVGILQTSQQNCQDIRVSIYKVGTETWFIWESHTPSKYIPLVEMYLISVQDVLCWEDRDNSTGVRVLCSVGEEHVPRARYPRAAHHAAEASSPVSDSGQGRCQPGHGLGQTSVWNVRGGTGDEQADTSSVSR